MNTEILSIISSLSNAFIKISQTISNTNPRQRAEILSTNASEDEVKHLDLIANDFLIDELMKNENVSIISSEEIDEIIKTKHNKDAKYFVSFDPLDGSSNIDSNITTGTIFGIYLDENIEETKFGKSIVAAGYCLYGGATELIYTIKNNVSINHFFLNSSKEFIQTHDIIMPKVGKYYSINQSNKYNWYESDKMNKIIEHFIKKKYSQRYVGSLVADAHRTLIKGGFFSYPIDINKKGKLRLLYESIPFCFLFQQAGGYAYLDDFNTLWTNTSFPTNDIHKKSGLTLCSEYENATILYI